MELQLKSPVSSGRRVPYRIETKNLSYKIRGQFGELSWAWCCGTPKRAPKFILKDVNCEARPGEITAIAGPSGAGKTTLQEILAGMISPRKMSAKRFRKISGYVTQDDALFPLLTVEEKLMYSAIKAKGWEKEAAIGVKRLMKELGLDHVVDSRIGGGSTRGISGGERRRVSIGVDLVQHPAVSLIDELTSGLDSASAHHGRQLCLTIHQPGFRILELFDRIVLLANGSVMHNGSLSLLEERFRLTGHFIPPHVNVLEFAMEVIESVVIKTSETLSNRSISEETNGQENKDEDHQTGKKKITTDEKSKLLFIQKARFKEVLRLGQGFCRNIVRTKQLFATRVIKALVAGFVMGTTFMNVGNEQGQRLSLTFMLSSTTEGLPIFWKERRILMNETSSGAYRVSSYVIANILVFLPLLLMVGILYTTPVYWLVCLRREIYGFLYFSLAVWMVLMSNSFVACFSALVSNFITGTSVISGLMGSFFLFSGYFISRENIPRYWKLMHYLSLFKYPFECFMINEYGGEQGRTRCMIFEGGQCSLSANGFLRQQGLQESRKWSNLALMLGFIIGIWV
ncbi:hypothetical protein I3760_12G110900 [Carya illinoinensis]|nr:hypothetical protein I3760_12G110900 [Carya illinoinensis]